MGYVRTRLGRWFFDERGRQGPGSSRAVIFLHALYTDGRVWRAAINGLAADVHCIALDGPGHGKSEVAPGFSLEDHADALVDAIDGLGVEHAVVVGHSWGGMAALRFAIRHPSRAAGLVLINTTASQGPRMLRRPLRPALSLIRSVGLPPVLWDRIIAPLALSGAGRDAFSPKQDELRRALEGFSRQGVASAMDAVLLDRRSLSSDLGFVRCPTLVVAAEGDRLLGARHGGRLAARIRGARLVRVPGSHFWPIEEPEALLETIGPFVHERIAA